MTQEPRPGCEQNEAVVVCLAGIGGAIGSTICVGIALAKRRLLDTLGLTTESPLLQPFSRHFIDLKDIVLHGWDLKACDIFNIAKDLAIAPQHFLREIKADVSATFPRMPILEGSDSVSDWIYREAALISDILERNRAQHGVLVNLCPTEPQSLQFDEREEETDWRNLANISVNTPGVTPSRLYFRLAIEANLHFVNFTPNIAETPCLRALAEEKSLIYCGRDGKTGQTFLKTVVAPAFRDRNLRIDGWYSTNLLGNADGLNLADEDKSRSKSRTKRGVLSQILGYQPSGTDSSHQVHIHYYPPRGDAKESWDNIDFTGFLGVPMQLKLNWLGQDSILAAPLVLDLVRLICFGASRKRIGLLHETSYFFKDPLVGPGYEIPCHSTPDQLQLLLGLLKTVGID